MSNNGKLFSIDEVASKLGLSVKTVRRYVQEGKLSAIKSQSSRGPYQIRISEQSILNYLGKIGQDPTQEFVQDVHVVQDVQDNVHVSLSKNEPLIQATYRIGYLEAQVDMTRKMLTEGDTVRQSILTERDLAIQEKAIAESKFKELGEQKEQILQEKVFLENRIKELADKLENMEIEVKERGRLEAELVNLCQEKEALSARVRDLERPWWKRLLGIKPQSNPVTS